MSNTNNLPGGQDSSRNPISEHTDGSQREQQDTSGNPIPESSGQIEQQARTPQEASDNKRIITKKKMKVVSVNFLKKKRHEFQILFFELEQQHELFHRIYTNQRLWHSRLSLFVILLSSTMTLMSSLTFVLPHEWVEMKHDRIPNIALSFLVTIISSILKWGGWDARSEETKTTATNITTWMTEIKNQLTLIDEVIGRQGNDDDYILPDDGNTGGRKRIEIEFEKYEELQKVQKEARAAVTKSRQVIFNLKPDMVLDYEKSILEGALLAQNTEITRTFSSMFKTKLDEYYKEEGNIWEVTDGRSEAENPDSDSSHNSTKHRHAWMAKQGDHSYLSQFSKLVNDQRNILATHEHMLRYASNYKRTLFAERGNKRGRIYALRKVLWWLCCCARCAEPEQLPIDPKPLTLENDSKIEIEKREDYELQNYYADRELRKDMDRQLTDELMSLKLKKNQEYIRRVYNQTEGSEVEMRNGLEKANENNLEEGNKNKIDEVVLEVSENNTIQRRPPSKQHTVEFSIPVSGHINQLVEEHRRRGEIAFL
tara:strand:- start:22 stop:1641 length:1620 start_codon:yes stop_codon:yes gene_type:complete